MSDSLAKHWIGGNWLTSREEGCSVNPATGEIIGRFANGGETEADLGIKAAKLAFKGHWRKDRQLRSQALNEAADRFEKHQDELIHALSLENGKTLGEAGFEISLVAKKLRYFAALALTDHGRALEVRPGQFSMILRQPIGVAGVIVPWNSPVILFVRSAAPALAAGCTVVAKLPAQTAQVNALMSAILSEVSSLPPGVINIFTESGADGAKLLVDSPDVPVISFTGSIPTAREISKAAAKRLKRVGHELGGKTPFIVFDDANLEKLLPSLEKAVTVFAGQFCMTGSRAIVQRGIAERVRSGLIDRLKGVKVGAGTDPTSDMGPMIDKDACVRVDSIVERAIAAGAKVLVRGGIPTDEKLSIGAYYQPALLEVTDSQVAIVREEVFGPVLTIQVFDTEQEAIDLANDNDYGLAASVWSQDIDRPLRVASEIEAGTVWINDWAAVFDECEEGGFKQSGLGRLNGPSALDDFLEYKHISHKVM